MNRRDDERIDHDLGGIAMAASAQHERTVTAEETEHALRSVRERIEAGDVGRSTLSSMDQARDRRRSPWLLGAAAAALVAVVAGGVVAVVGDRDDEDRLVPASVPDEVVPTTTAVTTTTETPDTTPATTVTPTTVTTTDADGSRDRTTLSVDASNPPRLVEPVPYASVPLAADSGGGVVNYAVGPDHVIVNQPGTSSITLVGRDGSLREVPTDEELSQVVSGPGPVVYGLGEPQFQAENPDGMPEGFRFVALPFLGDRQGQVVAAGLVGVNEYIELSPNIFGHASDGIVDRRAFVTETVFGYVDENGDPLDTSAIGDLETPFVEYETASEIDGVLVDQVGSSLGWRLDIVRDPAPVSEFGEPELAYPGAGRAVYATRVGAEQSLGLRAMPVVALMNPDGTGEWVRLPDDWDVVASDVWGTLLARTVDDQIELALLEDIVPSPEPVIDAPSSTEGEEPAPDPDDIAPTTTVVVGGDGDVPVVGELLAVPRVCASEFDCTSMAIAADGRIVTLDPLGLELEVWDADGSTLLLQQPIDAVLDDLRPDLVHVGPGDAAYVLVDDLEAGEQSGRVLAVALGGSQAGEVVADVGEFSRVGDSSLVPGPDGLVVVGCCGFLPGPVPEADDRIIGWVDAAGAPTTSDEPYVELEIDDAGDTMVRVDGGERTSFQFPTIFQNLRDFPTAVPSDSGGITASAFDSPSGVTVFVDADTDWPSDGRMVANGDIYYRALTDVAGGSIEIEPAGTVIVGTTNGFERRTLDQVATRAWPGLVEIDALAGTVQADGLNDYIDENQPWWAGDPTLFAYQVKQTLGPNEQVTIDVGDGESPTITITTSGFLDDSVAGDRITVETLRGDDGLLRFESATYGFRCARGPDTTSFQNDPCI